MTGRSADGRTWRIPRTGLVAAIVTFLVLGTSAGAYAFWTAQASLTSTAKAGSIAVSLAGFASMQNTYVNDARTRTGSVTVTNTTTSGSTTQIPVSVALDYLSGGSSVLASNLDVTMWGPTSATNCTTAATPSGTIKTGTWASIPTMTSTLSAGQAKTWCVRASNVERSTIASGSGTLTIQPRVTATLTAGTWSANASATSTQNTQYIFSAYTPPSAQWFSIVTASGMCVEVPASGGAGTGLVRANCSVVPNQAFALSGADANGYLAVTPKHNQGLRWDNGGSTSSGSAVTVQNSAGSGNQAWQLQAVSSGIYQIVNKNSGQCLSASAVAITQALCNGTAAQRFTLTAVTFSMNLVCTNTGNLGSKGRVTFSWSVGTAGVYIFQADHDASAGVNWETIGISVPNSTSVDIDGTLPIADPITGWASGTYDVRVLDTLGGVVATSGITVRSSGGLECG